MRCGEMTLGGWWPRVSSGTAGADIRQSCSARSCISPQSSFHSRWCLSCICGNHLGKSCVFFFCFCFLFFLYFIFFASQQHFTEFPIQSSTVNLGMKHLKGCEIYIWVHPSKKNKEKKLKADFKSEAEWRAVVDFLETLQRLLDRGSVPHQSEHLGYWPGISHSALGGPGSGRWDVEGLHMFTPSCLTSFVISPCDCSSVVGSTWVWDLNQQAGLAFCSLFLTNIHAFTCTHQAFYQVGLSLA